MTRTTPQQPRAAPEAPQASVLKLAREPVTLTLGAMLVEFAPVVGKAIEQWNRGELPGASEGIPATAHHDTHFPPTGAAGHN